MVTLATDDRAFPEALARLRESLARTGFDDELMAWEHGDLPEGSPAHEDVPFAFKPFALAEARERRASTRCCGWTPLRGGALAGAIFERIESDGYVLFRNGS